MVFPALTSAADRFSGVAAAAGSFAGSFFSVQPISVTDNTMPKMIFFIGNL
jgi:hypothetical protein